uniref:Uncharacterized protein n=1 Tax=Solanum lycopersicum TaxID=4081 RepID=A0A3Q7F2M9_SOLLC
MKGSYFWELLSTWIYVEVASKENSADAIKFPWMRWISINLGLIFSSMVQEKAGNANFLNNLMLFEVITKTLCSLIWKIACPYFHITNFANTLNVRINCYCPFEELSSLSKSQYLSSTQQQELTVEYIEDFDDDDDLDELDSQRFSRRVPMLLVILCLDCRYLLLIPLSSFKMYSFLAFTWMDGRYLYFRLYFFLAIGDDHLRETAYEFLLDAAGPSGLIVPSKEIKKEKTSRLMTKLGCSKSDNAMTQSQHLSVLVSLLETMRVQMEIPGGHGRQDMTCSVKHVGGGAYKSFCYRVGEAGIKAHERRVPLAKIEESELQLRVWGAKDLKAVGAHALTYTASPTQRCKGQCLKSLREIAVPLAERPAGGDLTGEEVKEILELLKSTWRNLGITETIHYTCYAWGWAELAYEKNSLQKGFFWLATLTFERFLNKFSNSKFSGSSLSGFCLDILVAARVGTHVEEVAVSSLPFYEVASN